MTQTGSPGKNGNPQPPESIRQFLAANGDVTTLPDWRCLVDAVTFGRRALSGEQALRVAKDHVVYYERYAASAAGSSEQWNHHHSQLRYYRWVVELLSDERLAKRFDFALPTGLLEAELSMVEHFCRRDNALSTVESACGFLPTEALEELAANAALLLMASARNAPAVSRRNDDPTGGDMT